MPHYENYHEFTSLRLSELYFMSSVFLLEGRVGKPPPPRETFSPFKFFCAPEEISLAINSSFFLNKKDQLDVTCFIISLFNAQHISDVNTSIVRSLRLIC